jgi:hypothetical protein
MEARKVSHAQELKEFNRQSSIQERTRRPRSHARLDHYQEGEDHDTMKKGAFVTLATVLFRTSQTRVQVRHRPQRRSKCEASL